MSLLKYGRGSSALVIKDSDAAGTSVGLDNDEIRDTVMTLSAMNPREYMEFRQAVIYGGRDAKLTGSEFEFKKASDKSIKKTINDAYDAIIKNRNLTKDKDKPAERHPNYENSTLRAFLPPLAVFNGLPISIQNELALDAYQQAYTQAVASFNRYFPEAFNKKQVQTEPENAGFAQPPLKRSGAMK